MKRRLLLTAAVAAPVAYLASKRPRRNRGAHDDYFSAIQTALKQAGLYRPTLVIDRERLAQNLGLLKQHLPQKMGYRIVAKSLPSLPLIREIRAATGTDRLMVFHQPHLNLIAAQMPDAQMLLGKPMPAGAARHFFDTAKPAAGFDAARQVEWLVDTPQRITEYAALARSRATAGSAPMRLNLEIDVGLHRGGFSTAQAVAEAVSAIRAEPALAFSGLMGYEPHAAKTPGALGGPRKALDQAMQVYAGCVEAARSVIGADFRPETLTLNSGGSNTYTMYSGSEPCNELSVGSALVKPTDFDTAGLQDHLPASFIATPVIKALDRNNLPLLERMTGLLRAWDPNTERSFFTYGGYWLASAVSPPGLQRNAIWGHSTNQDLLNGSRDIQLGVDDFVFLRPHQSEFVFLQFGDIAVYERGKIADTWPVFPRKRKRSARLSGAGSGVRAGAAGAPPRKRPARARRAAHDDAEGQSEFWGGSPYLRPSSEAIVDIQRRRLFLGLSRAVARKGYAAASVADVLAEVRISRRTFYELFKDKEDCFLAAYAMTNEALIETIRSARQAKRGVLAQLLAANQAHLRQLASQPEISQAFIVGIRSAGVRALQERARIHREFADSHKAFQRRCRQNFPDLPEPGDAVFMALVGGVNKITINEIEAGRAAKLEQLLPEVLYVTLSVYGLCDLAQRALRGDYSAFEEEPA